MENNNIYHDIAVRTGGDIYIGVVGPVRTGKSTFITRFINEFVLPNIPKGYAKNRTIDELPQSAQGKTIMTTQPKFVPNEAISIKIDDVAMKVRLIDCVGYIVDGVMGFEENSKLRMVKTPWQDKKMPFEEAAKIGTDKVIKEHSTFNVMITTDGSFGEIPRQNYIQAEEEVIKTLKENLKPFVIVVNSTEPKSDSVKTLCQSLSEKYLSKVISINVEKMTEKDVKNILAVALEDFPLEKIEVRLPKWMQALEFENPLIQEIFTEINKVASKSKKIGDFKLDDVMFEKSENFEKDVKTETLLSEGKIVITVTSKPETFYKELSKSSGIDIMNEFSLISYIKELSHAKREYDKIKIALEDAKESGYGVVFPTVDEMTMEDPTLVKQGTKFGVQIKATAPSLHIMKVDISAEVNPIVGSQEQSEELVKYIMDEYQTNPIAIWDTNMFGKSLSAHITEGLNSKILSMPHDTINKLRKTISRIINEGKGGVICILL